MKKEEISPGTKVPGSVGQVLDLQRSTRTSSMDRRTTLMQHSPLANVGCLCSRFKIPSQVFPAMKDECSSRCSMQIAWLSLSAWLPAIYDGILSSSDEKSHAKSSIHIPTLTFIGQVLRMGFSGEGLELQHEK